jgi:dCTP deaminase
MQELDLTAGTVLVAGCVYIIPLLESVALPHTLSAKANPKSTTGRLDVFARTITDFSENFDAVRRGYRGPLYAEVSPQTFSVFARTGDRLNQLRVRRSLPDEFHETTKAARAGGDQHLIWNEDGEPIKQPSVDEGLWFSVDTSRGLSDGIVGWRARRNSRVIDLRKLRHYPVREFWEPVPSCRFLTLEVGCFYILASKERVLVPPSYAAEMVAYDNTVGEFRVHYAGFFDPGFGYSKEGLPGTRAVLEVRSHEIPYILKDGQPVGRLQFEPMLAIPEKLYGEGAGSNYQDQGIGLAKQFQRS